MTVGVQLASSISIHILYSAHKVDIGTKYEGIHFRRSMLDSLLALGTPPSASFELHILTIPSPQMLQPTKLYPHSLHLNPIKTLPLSSNH